MIRQICLSLLFVGFINFTSSQTTFQKIITGSGCNKSYSIDACSDRGYIITGCINPFRDPRAFLLKLDASGQVQWTKTYGDGIGYSVKQTTDHGFIIAGNTSNSRAYLFKTNEFGNLLWEKSYHRKGVDCAYSVIQTFDGDFIAVGFTANILGSDDEVYMIKTNINGDFIWSKRLGVTGPDIGRCVIQSSDSGFVIAGQTQHGSGIANQDIYLIKTNKEGLLQWSNTFDNTFPNNAFSVEETVDKGFIIAGTSAPAIAQSDVYLVKTSSTGQYEWSKTLDKEYQDVPASIKKTQDNGFILTGFTQSGLESDFNIFLLKLDQTGAIQWSKTYGDANEVGCFAQQTADNGFIISGYKEQIGFGISCFYKSYILKTDSMGKTGCQEQNLDFNVSLPITSFEVPHTYNVSSRDTMTIISLPNEIILSDSLLCRNFSVPSASMVYDSACNLQKVQFNDRSKGFPSSWIWNFGDPTSGIENTSTLQNPVHLFVSPGSYTISLKAINGSISDDTTEAVNVKFCEEGLYLPNAFTPNGDNDNDVFYVFGNEIKTISLEIFNRWGQALFETDKITNGWNGKFENRLIQQDIYICRIHCVWNSGKEKTFITKLLVLY